MINKKLILLTILLAILTLSAVSASDNITGDIVSINEDSDLDILKENNANVKTFAELDEAINGNNDSDVYLDCDYTFNSSSDSNRVEINREVTIHGNGHTLDANSNDYGIIRAYDNNKVILKDIVFVNSKNSALEYGTAINCTFINNTNEEFGGALLEGTALNCTFINNTAGTGGGAVFDGLVRDCTFINNHAMYGGAVARQGDYYGSLQPFEHVINCTFINNTADCGGAMAYGGAINCTFISNYANFAGAVFEGSAINSIFKSNRGENGGAASKSKLDNCTFTDNQASYHGGALHTCEVSTDCQFNGNSAKTGNDTYNCTFARIGKSFSELNYLINENMNTVYLKNNYTFVSSVDSNLKGGIEINKPLTIYGNGFTLNGNHSARIFFANNNEVEFHDIIFINGESRIAGAILGKCKVINCTFINNAGAYGGAIENSTAINCIFINNSAHDRILDPEQGAFYEGRGGAIYIGTAVNCTFINNNADHGGAVHRVSAINCTFINNTAMDGGAADYGEQKNCIFENNTANYGGAIYNGQATNCNFTNNNARFEGGAMNFGSAIDCTFINNSAIYPYYFGSGGAINNGTAVNCTFENNTARFGGAMCGDDYNATDCRFKENNAIELGGGMCNGNAIDCIFRVNVAGEGNNTYNTTVYKPVLSVSNFTATYNSGEKLLINFTSATGQPISNANVTIRVYKDNILVGTYYCLSGDGWVINIDAGKYMAVCSVENQEYDADSVNATLTIDKMNTILTSTNVTAVYNGNGILEATLNDMNGNPIANVNVTIDLNGEKTLKTDENGQVNLTTNNLTPKTYTAKITFKGNGNYNESASTGTITIQKINTKITSTNVTTVYNGGDSLIVTLKDGHGNPISDENITIELNGAKTLTTNSDGQVELSTDNLTPNTYNVKATFAGSEIYNGASFTGSVTVKKATPKLSAKSKTFKRNVKTKKYSVKLKTNNEVIKKAKVTFKIKGKKYSAKTNEKGVATFKITKLTKKGTFNGVVTYKGNSNYNKVTESVKIKIK